MRCLRPVAPAPGQSSKGGAMRHYLYRQRKDRLFCLLVLLGIGWALAACGSVFRPVAGPHPPASAETSAPAALGHSPPPPIPPPAPQGDPAPTAIPRRPPRTRR